MATVRPRTAGLGALRRQSIRVYNEPFTPAVEERDENEAHILVLKLTEFNEQHVKVKVEKEERVVVVTGDRLIGNNRLLILNKTYQIPQNCAIDKIYHKLEDGFLTITMPKQTTPPAVDEAAATVAPPPKEPEQTTSEKGSEEMSPVNATPRPKEPEQTTQAKGSEEISRGNKAPPETKSEIKELEEEEKGKSTELQKQASAKAKEEAPAPAVAPPPAADKKSPVQGDSGEGKTKLDQKISSPDQKATEKKAIENQNPEKEKEKESKAEEEGKNEETAKIGTGTSTPKATGITKLASGFTFRRMLLPSTASVAAAVGMAAAVYLAYAYYGMSFAME